MPVTLFSLEECCVVGKNPGPKEGEILLQVGSGKLKNPNKPQEGFFKKAGVPPKRVLKSFKVDEDQALDVGTFLRADFFKEGAYVDVSGITIGRGFAGGMKRHHFGGLRATHGVSVSHRSIGSTGHRKSPGKVFKGKKMPGHMGSKRRTMQNLEIVKLDVDKGLLIIKGSVPGFEGSWVEISDAIKKRGVQKTLMHKTSRIQKGAAA